MSRYDPTGISSVKAMLSRYGVWLTRSMGQHLLVDRSVVQRIAAAAGVAATDEVLEIGPGAGALTRALAARARRVVAVELDPRLVAALREMLAAAPTDAAGAVEVIQADALQVEPETLFDQRPYKVVANLPYNVATPLLRGLLYHPRQPSQLTVMVQKEVAQRLAAAPGQTQRGVLSIQIQLVADVELLFDVPPEAFFPPPKVDSTVAQLTPHATPRVDLGELSLQRFLQTVEAGFGQRRKQLHNALGSLSVGTERIHAALAAADVAPDRRAQTLSLAEWAALARALWTRDWST